jgi:hypothetical protein
LNTHNLKVDFGRHRDMLYTRVPVSYLKWMVQSNHTHKDIAEAELARRGTVTSTLDISGHAIDRASLRCHDIWMRDAKKSDKDGVTLEEGLHAWLVRICTEALVGKTIADYPECNDCEIIYKGMKLVFQRGAWPVLKTIMPCKKTEEAEYMDYIKEHVSIGDAHAIDA